uniref:Glutamate-1-semialdehyde 2,1-aminomutase n=1 Tax=Anthurium amnicola TaxID=1678845 RepID=A0A1D1Z4S4_9ARAE
MLEGIRLPGFVSHVEQNTTQLEQQLLLQSYDANSKTSAVETDVESFQLKQMVDKLKCMHSFLHSGSSSPLSIREIRLYGLIMRHVDSYILIYLMEDNSKLQHIIKPSLECTADEKFVTSHVSTGKYIPDDPYQKMRTEQNDLWSGFYELLSTLKEWQSSTFSHVDFADTFNMSKERKKIKLEGVTDKMLSAVEVDDFQVDEIQNREELLSQILFELEDMGRRRIYAPPLGGLIKHYREIRMRCLSILAFTEAKSKHQNDHNANVEGEEKWIYADLGALMDDVVLNVPYEWRIAAMFERLPDLIVLLKECKTRILGDDYGEKLDDTVRGTKAAQQRRKVPPERKEARCTASSTKLPVGRTTKSRVDFLQDILSIMNTIDLLTPPTVEELRLFLRIFEHVLSSLWLARTHSSALPEQNQQGANNGTETSTSFEQFVGRPYDLSEHTNMINTDRVACLRQAVFYVEEIKYGFVDIPPTADETKYYKMLKRCMQNDFMRHIQGKRLQFESLGASELQQYMGVVYVELRKLWKSLDVECSGVVKAMFPQLVREGSQFSISTWEDDDKGFLVTLKDILLGEGPPDRRLSSCITVMKAIYVAMDWLCYIFICLTLEMTMVREKFYERCIRAAHNALYVWQQRAQEGSLGF